MYSKHINFKELYMEQSVKTHKRKSKNLVDPGDLVSEKSLDKVYTILGRVITLTNTLLSFQSV